MKKLEMSEELKVLYASKQKKPFLVDVPVMNYITYNGKGHPKDEDFQTACNCLFNLAYIIKFKIARIQNEIDYKVSPMEVDWFLNKSKGKIDFTWVMMIMQPDFITAKIYKEAGDIAKKSKPEIPFEKVQFQKIKYGKCIQVFHAGDYLKMNDTLAIMKEYGKSLGYETEPFTHDIYLNDSRKTKTENLKSIMRVKVLNK